MESEQVTGENRWSEGSTPLLRITSLSKSFAGTKALDAVSLEVHAGEIVAIVGQNGSGKSTLVKVLAGVHEADPGGKVEVRDGAMLQSAAGVRQQTLHFIHQDLGLLPMLSTTENLGLGRPVRPRDLLPMNRAAEHERAATLLAQFGVRIDVRAPVAQLSPAEKAIVAIARALDGWTRTDNVLVLDEPTAAFHADEVQRLFAAVRRVAGQGAGVIFISHRLEEVDELADRVIVLRDGKLVAEVAAGQFDRESLVHSIVGSSVDESRRARANEMTTEVLVVEGLVGNLVRDLTFSVCQGEVVGIAGVLGSGREEIGGLLFGALRRRGGTLQLGGEALEAGDMASAIELGMAFVPADRMRLGGIQVMSMRENLTLPSLRQLRGRFGRLKLKAERAESHYWANTVELRPAEPERPLLQFSGGNQQKVVLAKWLRTKPRLLVLDEPTAGVDVGAKATIYELLLQAAAEGTAVLVCSSDTKELAVLCDRVIVLEGGRSIGEVEGEGLSEEALLRQTLVGAGATPEVDS